MKLAICNELFEGYSHQAMCEYVHDVGFDGVEFAPFTLVADHNAKNISNETVQDIFCSLSGSQLTCVGLHWLLAKTEGFYLTSPDETIRKSTGEYFATLARLCGDLGGSILVLGSPQQRNLLPGVSHQQAMEFAADTIRIALPEFEKHDIVLALEPLGPKEGNFLNTAESAIELAKLLDSPHVRLHLDVKAMASESKPIPQIIKDSDDWIAHFHANDPNLLGPGMGEVQFEPIIEALHDIKYEGWLSVEVFDYSPGVQEICQRSIDTLRRCLDLVS